LRFHNPQLYGFEFGFQSAKVPLLGGRAFAWTLDVEDESAARQQSRKLASLDAADFLVVRSYGKDGTGNFFRRSPM